MSLSVWIEVKQFVFFYRNREGDCTKMKGKVQKKG